MSEDIQHTELSDDEKGERYQAAVLAAMTHLFPDFEASIAKGIQFQHPLPQVIAGMAITQAMVMAAIAFARDIGLPFPAVQQVLDSSLKLSTEIYPDFQNKTEPS
jgi:hypothetical protein